jgi:hypothetical protein
MATDLKRFFPRYVYCRITWKKEDFFTIADSMKSLISILRDQTIGNLTYTEQAINKELEHILTANDYNKKELILSTEIDDNGGYFVVMPLDIEHDEIIKIEGKAHNLWFALNRKTSKKHLEEEDLEKRKMLGIYGKSKK